MAFEDEEFLVQKDLVRFKESMVIRQDSTDSEKYDENGNPYTVKVAGEIDSTWVYDNFASIELKEDWFFDKQKSVMEVRIIGIGINAYLKGKEDLGAQTLFYVYFPACRPLFAKHEVYNTKNDAERRSFDDIFWKRQFNSTITKESNVFDRKVDDYLKGLDALLENERIKNDIFKYEHDFWQF
jgi:gliding motility associated protien GldN